MLTPLWPSTARILLIVSLALALSAEVRRQLGGPQQTQPPRNPGAMYGRPEPRTLTEIAVEGSPQKHNVLTRGYLEPLVPGRYYRLSEEGVEVLLIPMEGMTEALRRLLGHRIELTGLVRVLPMEQKYHPACGIESKCDDPELPELPNARPDWPRVSITVFTADDITPLEPGRRATPATRIEDLLADPSSHTGRDVTVVGLFRGRNLYGDLTGGVADAAAWVLKDGDAAIWVTGRKPEGKGFRLDPQYKGDTTRWLEVRGRVQVLNGMVTLKASRVVLTSAPEQASRPD